MQNWIVQIAKSFVSFVIQIELSKLKKRLFDWFFCALQSTSSIIKWHFLLWSNLHQYASQITSKTTLEKLKMGFWQVFQIIFNDSTYVRNPNLEIDSFYITRVWLLHGGLLILFCSKFEVWSDFRKYGSAFQNFRKSLHEILNKWNLATRLVQNVF